MWERDKNLLKFNGNICFLFHRFYRGRYILIELFGRIVDITFTFWFFVVQTNLYYQFYFDRLYSYVIFQYVKKPHCHILMWVMTVFVKIGNYIMYLSFIRYVGFKLVLFTNEHLSQNSIKKNIFGIYLIWNNKSAIKFYQ